MHIFRRKPPIPLRRRIPLWHPDLPYVLFWSHKSGCTTVVKWFFAQVGLLDEALAHSSWIHDYEQHVYKTRDGYMDGLRQALADKSRRAVKVVRHPLRRVPSAFLILAEPGAVSARAHWIKAYWGKVDAWLAERGQDPAAGISFVEHLEMIRQIQAKRAMSVNPHFAPQHLRGEERFVQEVVPIERFADWARAAAVREVDWARIADSRHHHAVDPERTAALGERPEAARLVRGAYRDGRYPASEAFLTERAMPLVREVYGADLAAYGAHYDLAPARAS